MPLGKLLTKTFIKSQQFQKIYGHTFQSRARVCCKLRILKENPIIIHLLNWPVSIVQREYVFLFFFSL